MFESHPLTDRPPNTWGTSLFKDAPSCRTGLSAEGTSPGKAAELHPTASGDLNNQLREMMGLSRDNDVTANRCPYAHTQAGRRFPGFDS